MLTCSRIKSVRNLQPAHTASLWLCAGSDVSVQHPWSTHFEFKHAIPWKINIHKRVFSVCNLEEQEDPRAFSYTHAVPAEGTIFICFTKVSALFIPKYNANGEWRGYLKEIFFHNQTHKSNYAREPHKTRGQNRASGCPVARAPPSYKAMAPTNAHPRAVPGQLLPTSTR